MISKESHFNILFNRLGTIFNELLYIQMDVKNTFLDNSQSVIIQDKFNEGYIKLLETYAKIYNDELSNLWSLNKKIEFVFEDIRAFFRQFENPNLNSSLYYERIKFLLELLAHEQEAIKNLLKL